MPKVFVVSKVSCLRNERLTRTGQLFVVTDTDFTDEIQTRWGNGKSVGMVAAPSVAGQIPTGLVKWNTKTATASSWGYALRDSPCSWEPLGGMMMWVKLLPSLGTILFRAAGVELTVRTIHATCPSLTSQVSPATQSEANCCGVENIQCSPAHGLW